MGQQRCNVPLLTSVLSIIVFVWYLRNRGSTSRWCKDFQRQSMTQAYNWRNRTERFPIFDYKRISPPDGGLRKIQHNFGHWYRTSATSQRRQAEVKRVFTRCWLAYKENAWLSDELTPISGGERSHLGGRGATLVDSLGSLYIMGLRDEFAEAVEAVMTIDFSTPSDEENSISLFETSIRYLSGLFAAYDLSCDKRLLQKGVQLGDMLYCASDTPNHMPITRWDWFGA